MVAFIVLASLCLLGLLISITPPVVLGIGAFIIAWVWLHSILSESENKPYDMAIKDLEAGLATTIECWDYYDKYMVKKRKIKHGSTVTVIPISIEDVHRGDIVLCKVYGHGYLGMVIYTGGTTVMVSRGACRGTFAQNIYGKVVEIPACSDA